MIADSLILGIDPGKRSGYVLIRGETPIEWGSALSAITTAAPFVAVIERPEIRKGPTGRISPQSVVTLAFDAGRRFGEVKADPRCAYACAIVPSEWKGWLFRGGERVEKSVYLTRVRRVFGVAFDTDDQTDAYAIALSYRRHTLGVAPLRADPGGAT